ncbi:MAG: BamA/TamA family outer membrane protein [Pseudomonadota bacterium]
MWRNQKQLFAFLFAAVLFPLTCYPQDTATNGERMFRAIQVTGNDRFRDGDILETSGLKPGEAYTESDLVAAVEALEFTGEFRRIRIFSEGDVLTIDVREEPEFSGNLTFGLGYDSDTSAFGFVGLRLEDILGGRDLSARVTIAEEVQSGTFDFSGEPFWFGSRAGGVRGSVARYDYDDTLFDFSTAAVAPYLSFGNRREGFSGDVRLTVLGTDISSVDPAASAILLSEEGERLVAGPGLSLRWSDATRNRWSAGINVDVFGGDSEFVDTSVAVTTRLPISGSLALRTQGRIGAVTGIGDGTTTVAERRTLGGSTMRGFARGGITPVDFCAGCGAAGEDINTSLGGERYAVLQNDLLFTGLGNRLPLVPSIYFDVGSVWSVDSATAPSGVLLDEQEWRSSIGLALSAETNLGIFSASVALETESEDFDDEEQFTLSFIASF